MNSNTPVVMIGLGGHAKVLVETIRLRGRMIVAAIDSDRSKWGTEIFGIPIIGGDDKLADFASGQVELVNGIGSVHRPTLRREVFLRLQGAGFRFSAVVHPAAFVAASASIGEGAQVMACAAVQADVVLKENCIINTGAVVDHDCRVGAHSHIAPGAAMSGDVIVGSGTHVGIGAAIVQGMHIGANCVIGAGAVVIGNIPDNVTAVGVPARIVKSNG